jgi:hypothetical protein
MKPWQGLLKKAPAKGKRKNKERRPKPEPEVQKLNAGHTKGQRNKIMFRSPHPEPSSVARSISKRRKET